MKNRRYCDKDATGALREVELSSRVDLVVIGASTGGPKALMDLVPELPADLAAPILIVQHIPSGFTESFAGQLDSRSRLAVREARNEDFPAPGEALVAPGGKHITAKRTGRNLQLFLEDGPPDKGGRPSLDVVLMSLARVERIALITVTMTGMGKDGAHGISALPPESSYNIVQQPDTCLIPGMPSAVIDTGAVDEIVPPDKLAGRIISLAGTV